MARARELGSGEDTGDADPAAPWPIVVVFAGGAVWCLWHAHKIDVTESPDAAVVRQRWILAGLLFTGLAIGLAFLASDQKDLEPQ